MKKLFSRQIFLNLKDHFPKTPKSLSTPGKIWRTRRLTFSYSETPTLLGQVPPSGWFCQFAKEHFCCRSPSGLIPSRRNQQFVSTRSGG
jgi:hypothetical protein